MQIRNVLFDLDGTLIDSAADVLHCLEYAYSKIPRFRNLKLNRSSIGPALTTMIRNITPGIKDTECKLVIDSFKRCYDKSIFPRTSLYPSARDVLNQLYKSGMRLYLVTNKRSFPTKNILKKFKLEIFVDTICPDSIPDKTLSKSEMIAILVKKWQLEADTTIMVGDSDNDITAAKANGIKSIAVLSGYGISNVYNNNPEYIIPNIKSLLDLIQK